MNSFQVVLEKIFMNNFLLSEEITSAFPKLLGNCSWGLGQCIGMLLSEALISLFLNVKIRPGLHSSRDANAYAVYFPTNGRVVSVFLQLWTVSCTPYTVKHHHSLPKKPLYEIYRYLNI
jgi:hypothetical protein